MEKDWSCLSQDFDELQKFVAGKEIVNTISGKLMTLQNTGSVLELGCGNGFYTQFLTGSADQITATDISTDMVNAAKDKLAKYRNVNVEQADAYNTEYENSSFDSVFMANLIHVVEKPGNLLSEIQRVLKPNGLLIISTFTAYGMTKKDIEEMFERYIKAFGTPPANGTIFTMDALISLVSCHKFSIQQAELIGDTTKSIFLVAQKT